MDKKLKVLGIWSPNWDGPYVIKRVLSRNAYAIREVNTDSYIGFINGKLGCKFMNNDDALVTRIFKSKYFPGGTFWT